MYLMTRLLCAILLFLPGCAYSATGFPPCFGASEPLRVSREMPYAAASLGGKPALFLLDYGANVSSIDLKAVPWARPSSCSPQAAGGGCSFNDFAFAGAPGGAWLLTADYSGLSLDFRQAGVIGTDFLSEHAYTLDYDGGKLLRAGKDLFCSPSGLKAAGFAPMSSAGYFSSDLNSLLPLSSLNAGYSGGLTVPNIPAVPLRIAGVTALAQIDTGYSDYISRHSVNVNPAFYGLIAKSAPGALERREQEDRRLSTCVPGVTETVEAYRLREGGAELLDENGGVLRSFPSAVIYVKRTPAAAARCGGISSYSAPAAQLGGSFMRDLGVVVFDPFSSKVWAPRR